MFAFRSGGAWEWGYCKPKSAEGSLVPRPSVTANMVAMDGLVNSYVKWRCECLEVWRFWSSSQTAPMAWTIDIDQFWRRSSCSESHPKLYWSNTHKLLVTQLNAAQLKVEKRLKLLANFLFQTSAYCVAARWLSEHEECCNHQDCSRYMYEWAIVAVFGKDQKCQSFTRPSTLLAVIEGLGMRRCGYTYHWTAPSCHANNLGFSCTTCASNVARAVWAH